MDDAKGSLPALCADPWRYWNNINWAVSRMLTGDLQDKLGLG